MLFPTARRTFSHTPGTKERCEIELREETARHILRVLLCEVREIERRFVKPHGLRKSSWQDADRRVCGGVAPTGAERDIPKIAGRFLRAWARPVNAPERSEAARRSAFFAERGLMGRDPRPYPLPASERLAYCRREAYGDALPTLSSRSVSRAACVIAVRLPRSPRPICPSRAAVPSRPNRAPFYALAPSWSCSNIVRESNARTMPSTLSGSYCIAHWAWSSPQA